MNKYSKKYWIFRWLFLAAYVGACGVLIVEAATPGAQSAAQSNAVGGAIGKVVNDMGGDQAKEIMPTSVSITNTKKDFFVGDTTEISLETSPKDATYKSYTYSTSDEDIATVDETGLVFFVKAGSVTITAMNSKVDTIKDSIDFTISNILVTSMTSTISADKDASDNYLLEVDRSYVVKNVIEPENATDKAVTYEYAPNDFIEMQDDTIKVLANSGDQVITILAKCGDITNTLKVKTFEREVVVEDYPLTGLKASNVTKYIDQTSVFTPSVSYVPSYVSSQYKGYQLSTNDTSIVQVQSNGTSLKITGTAGTAVVTATSTKNPEISTTFSVVVKARPGITGIRVYGYSETMYVGNSTTISVSISPSGVLATKSFTSNNTSVLTVTSAGKVTAKATGNATVTVKVTDSYGTVKQQEIGITVVNKPINAAEDFVVDYKQGENPIVYADEEVNLDSYFGISSFVNSSGTLDKNNFEYIFDVNDAIGTYDSRKYTPHSIGKIRGLMAFTNDDGSVIYNAISFIVMDRYTIKNGEENIVGSVSFPLYSTNVISISDSSKYNQRYKISVEHESIVGAALSGKSITIVNKERGSSSITVTPMITIDEEGNYELDAKTTTFTVSSFDVHTSKLDVTLKHKDGSVAEDGIITLYMNDILTVTYDLDKETTRSDIEMTLSTANAVIKNGVITPRQVGNTTLTVKETYSNIVKEYEIAIRNKVSINQNKYFIIGGKCTYDGETNTLTIVNGETGKIAFNFLSDTTYRTTVYSVADESIALIGKDGTITPLKIGETKIYMSIKDRLSEHINVEVNLKVTRKDFIENMGEFFRAVRKAIGHFGAFAAVGLIGTIMFFLWMRKKWFPLGVGINFTCGFGLAALTEYIQTFVPGRYGAWSDIWLDFSGFSIAAGVTTLVIIAIYLIKKYGKKKKVELEQPKE